MVGCGTISPMNEQRLKQIKRQYDELQQRLQEPGSWQDPALFARLQRELQELSPVAEEIGRASCRERV